LKDELERAGIPHARIYISIQNQARRNPRHDKTGRKGKQVAIASLAACFALGGRRFSFSGKNYSKGVIVSALVPMSGILTS
jgi:hypothetical protein